LSTFASAFEHCHATDCSWPSTHGERLLVEVCDALHTRRCRLGRALYVVLLPVVAGTASALDDPQPTLAPHPRRAAHASRWASVQSPWTQRRRRVGQRRLEPTRLHQQRLDGRGRQRSDDISLKEGRRTPCVRAPSAHARLTVVLA
jgi:hypothetical protein